MSKPERHRHHYSREEVADICLHYANAHSASILSCRYQRTTGAIDWILAYRDRPEKFTRLSTTISRHIDQLRKEGVLK